ncbi:MAG: hypothetical protein ACO1N8_11215 [Methylophilus sp.]
MTFKKRGKPKSDQISCLQAKAWFSAVARLGAGEESVFSDIEKPLSTTEIDKRLGSSACESRLSRKWRNGENRPSHTNKVNLYLYFKWIDKKTLGVTQGWGGHTITNANAFASAELTLNSGPDGSNLWNVLRNPIKIEDITDLATGLANPDMARSIKYSDATKIKFSNNLCIPIFTALLSDAMMGHKQKLLDKAMWHMADNFHAPEKVFFNANIRTEIELEKWLVDLCTKRFEWYGISINEVFEIANVTLKIT